MGGEATIPEDAFAEKENDFGAALGVLEPRLKLNPPGTGDGAGACCCCC